MTDEIEPNKLPLEKHTLNKRCISNCLLRQRKHARHTIECIHSPIDFVNWRLAIMVYWVLCYGTLIFYLLFCYSNCSAFVKLFSSFSFLFFSLFFAFTSYSFIYMGTEHTQTHFTRLITTEKYSDRFDMIGDFCHHSSILNNYLICQ